MWQIITLIFLLFCAQIAFILIQQTDFPEATEERGAALLKQEKLDNVFLLNITAGKSWRIKVKHRP
jgi:hypothetical protein